MDYIRKTVDIYISDKLKDILLKFNDSSLVARMLLKKRHYIDELVDGYVNYISISNTDSSKISYLTQDRIKRIDNSDYWMATTRFQIKPGSFINKIFCNIPVKEIEIFANIFKLHTENDQYDFSVVSGDDIKKWYHYKNYFNQSSSLGNSCMKHDNCQDYFELYTKNPDIVKLLILTDSNNRLIGRSLLWYSDKKIMDRIYTVNDDKLCFKFKKWADDNGFIYKMEQKWNNTSFFESNNKSFEEKISIKIPEFKFGLYPYIDTFKFIDMNDGILYNHLPKSKNIRTLCSSDGSHYDEKFLLMDDISHQYHYSSDISHLDYCELNVHNSLVVYSESNEKCILEKHAVWKDEARDWIFNDEYDQYNDQESIKQRLEKISLKRPKSSFFNMDFISSSNFGISLEDGQFSIG